MAGSGNIGYYAMRLISLLFVFVSVTGCSHNPVPDMYLRTIPDVQGRHEGRLDYLSVVYNTGEPRFTMGTSGIADGQHFRLWFKNALQDAIERSLIFKSGTDTLYLLEASVLKDQLVGNSSDRELSVRYFIRDRSTSDIVFDQTINTVGQIPFRDRPLGIERMRESEGQAARQNIRDFLVSLSKADLGS